MITVMSSDWHADTEPLIAGTLLTDERVIVPRLMMRNIRAHAIEYAPQEVCGLIGGAGEHFTVLARLPNHAMNPEHEWRIEASHAYETEMEFKKRDVVLRAVYHSHPRSEAKPSLSDLKFEGDIYTVIYSIPDDELRVWRGEKPIDLEVKD